MTFALHAMMHPMSSSTNLSASSICRRNESTTHIGLYVQSPPSKQSIWHQHHGLLDLAELGEVRPDLVRGRLLADAADEDLLGLVGLALALRGGVLGVDLLPVEGVVWHGEDTLHGVGGGEGDEAETTAPLLRTKRKVD